MDKKTKDKIIQWIYDNHIHHVGSTRVEMMLQTGEVVMVDSSKITGRELCEECDYPYVNSLDLEKFIKSLEVK